VADGLVELQDAERQQRGEAHPGQADVGRPEADARPALRPSLGRDEVAQAEHRQAPGQARYVLGNCPYREAVRENQPAVCSLHRGITQGLRDRLDPDAALADFVARDPYRAGCLIEVRGPAARWTAGTA
jgi:predicted ArsR family transcriptional regulator